MVDIVRRMGWSYVSIIYEESNYGIKVCLNLSNYVLYDNDINKYIAIPYNKHVSCQIIIHTYKHSNII